MRKLLILLALIPLIAAGQSTTTLKIRKLVTDSIYFMKPLASSGSVVLVIDTVTGKVGLNKSFTGGSGDSYWSDQTNLITKTDTTKGFYSYASGALYDSYISQAASGGGVSINVDRKLTSQNSYLSILNTSSAIGKLSVTNTAGKTDYIQLTGGFGYLAGSSTLNHNNRMNLGSVSSPWGIVNADTAKLLGAYITGLSKATGTTYRVVVGTDGKLYKSTYAPLDPSDTTVVTSVTATAPVASTGGATPVISMERAGAAQDGYLTSTDWNTFNNKVSSQWTTAAPGITYNDTAAPAAVQTPVIYGGSAVGSSVKIFSTTGAGTTTGIAGQLSGGTAGATNALTWLNNGRVGIGTTAPVYVLEVNGTISCNGASYMTSQSWSASYNGAVKIGNESTGSNSAIRFDTKNAEKMRLNPDGYLGIGTTAPTAKLHVAGSAKVTDTLFNATHVGGTDVGSSVKIFSTTGAGTTTGIAGQLSGGTAGATNALTWLNNGRVGINRADPGFPLDVNGDIKCNSTMYMGSASSAINTTLLHFTTNNPAQIYNINTGANSALSFATKNVERMRIDPSGNVGIGTTAPTAKLHVASGTIKVTGSSADSVTISTSRAVRLYGDAAVWDDLIFSFSTGVNGLAAYPAYNADSMYWNFVVDTTGPSLCKKYYTVQIPHRAKEGNITIYPHVHYRHTTAQGTPTFIIKYRWYNINEKPGAWSWRRLTSTTGTTDGTHQLNYSTTGITKANSTLSSLLDVQVYLYSQTGTGGIDAMQFDLHIPIDKIGSDNEVTNN